MLIGLTGAPGCGKSAALKIFASLGWFALDADALCRELYSEPRGPLARRMAERWGEKALDPEGRPSRPFIASVVFNDAKEREWLDALVHPEILEAAKARIAKAGVENAVFEAPLLFEAAWRGLFKSAAAVWCSPAVQLERLRARGWGDDDIRRRLASQLSAERKLELADFGLINNSSLDALRVQCEALSKIFRNS